MDDNQPIVSDGTRPPDGQPAPKPLDVWHIAGLLIRHHDRRALGIAARRAMRLGESGDRDGALEWLEISRAVRELQQGKRS
ncbi:MAG: hypothetical protein NVV74_13385 [Magnetospirillum sp.]|nr:hypothetical protein [Magnetospirillum sp.]